jgi:hypothetical protein
MGRGAGRRQRNFADRAVGSRGGATFGGRFVATATARGTVRKGRDLVGHELLYLMKTGNCQRPSKFGVGRG